MKKQSALLILLFCFLLHADSRFPADPALNPVTFLPADPHAGLELLKDGRPDFVITGAFAHEKETTCRAWRSVTLAAEALADAFERTTGLRPPVVEDGSQEARQARLVLALGESSYSRALNLNLKALPREAFYVKSFAGGVVIAGNDGSFIPGSYHHLDWSRYRLNGTLNGAYDFIERFLDVRYYFPGIGITAPKLSRLSIAPVFYRDEPYFHNRYNWGYEYELRQNWPWPEVRNENHFDNAWRMGMSTRFNDVCHTPDPHYLLATYPDRKKDIFYTDKNGYTYYNAASHIGNLMDITNPKLAELLVESYRKFYATDGKWREPWLQNNRGWYPPNSEYVLFGQADTFVQDLNNEKTKHLFPPSRPRNVVSDLYMNFYVQIAQGLKQYLPGKRLGVLAYHNYTLPPIICTDIPDNIDVQVCEGRLVMAKATETQKKWTRLFQDWYNVLGGRKVTAWTYGSQNNQFTQAIQGQYGKDFIRLLKPYLSREGFFFDASGLKWPFYYSYYVFYRSLWNPDFNVQAALDEHWERLYGREAGKHLREFYSCLVERWENVYIADLNQRGLHESNTTPERLYNTYNLPVIDKLEKLLKQALAATAPGSIQRRRAEFFARPWASEFTSARAYCTQITPVYKIKKLDRDKEPVLDGRPDEGCWKNAAPIVMKDALGRGKALPSRPQAKILWNSKGLYIGFQCQGKPRLNKGDIWFDSDNIELFLSPGTDKAVYYHFAVNPTEDWYDSYKVEKPMEAANDPKWSAEGAVKKVFRSDKEWSAEIFIPFSALHRRGAPRVYSTWFANIINNKADEYSSFSMTMGNNHNHDLWGKIKFMGTGD